MNISDIYYKKTKMGLNKCCCCIDLRTGCIILAVLGIIVNCGFFGFADSRCFTTTVNRKEVTNCVDDFYVITAGNVIGIKGCVCLLFGSIKYNRVGVLVYLTTEIIRVILHFAGAIMIFIWLNSLGGILEEIGGRGC